MKLLSIAIALSLLTAGIVAGGIWFFGRSVTVLLPSQFHGLIRIRLSDSDSDAIERGVLNLRIRVPASGELHVKTLNEFRRLSKFEVRDGSGVELKQAFLGSSPVGIRFWHLNSPPKEQVFFFVGTFDEMGAFVKSHEQELYSTK